MRMKNSGIHHFTGYFTAILMLLLASTSYAQNEIENESECVRTLAKAQKTYEEGLIEKVEPMIRPCLNSGELNKSEQMEGYKLIALSKLYDNKDEEAEAAMIQFLKIDPEYQYQPGVDPKEFGELFAGYHTSPLYTIGVQFGLNFTNVNSYLERGTYNTVNEKKNFSSNLGIQFGVKVSRYIYDGLNVNIDLLYAQNSYTYTHSISENTVDITALENQNMLNVPLSLSYTFRRSKSIKPYIEAGFGMRYLFSATQTPTKEIPSENITIAGSAIDILNERNSLNFEGVFGAGVKYKIPQGDLFLNFRYTLGIGNQRNTSSGTELNDDLRYWTYNITDNDFSINNMIISVGYNYYLYKPRKKKENNSAKKKEFKDAKPKKVKEPKKEEPSTGDTKRRVIE